MKTTIKSPMKWILTLILAVFLFQGTAVSQNLNPNVWPNLVGYWNFQETSDLLKATVGNDLILVGDHQWVKGAFYETQEVIINVIMVWLLMVVAIL